MWILGFHSSLSIKSPHMYPFPSEQHTSVNPSPAATSVAGAGIETFPGVALYLISSQSENKGIQTP